MTAQHEINSPSPLFVYNFLLYINDHLKKKVESAVSEIYQFPMMFTMCFLMRMRGTSSSINYYDYTIYILVLFVSSYFSLYSSYSFFF